MGIIHTCLEPKVRAQFFTIIRLFIALKFPKGLLLILEAVHARQNNIKNKILLFGHTARAKTYLKRTVFTLVIPVSSANIL